MNEPALPAAIEVESDAVGHRRVLSSMFVLGGATVLIKFVALAKDLLVAKQLGAGDALDAYLVAFVLPSYAAVVLAHTLASAFVPTYVRVWRRDGLDAARPLAGGVLTAAMLVLTLATMILWFAAPVVLPLVGSGFDSSKQALTQSLFFPLVGVVLASGLSAVFAAILNAHERFAAVAIAPLGIPFATLTVFWLGQREYGVHALAVGTTLGFLCETVVLALAAWWTGLLPQPKWDMRGPELSRVAAQYVPVVVAGLLMSSALVVDQSMAASLGSGQVSVLNYGGKVVAVVLSIVAASLSTVLFSRFTHLLAAGRTRQFKRTFRLYAIGVVLVSVPAVALLAIFTPALIRLLFERGAFTPETTVAVSRVQWWLLPQIPFYVLTLLGGRVLSALEGNAVVLRIAALNVLVNVTGNLLLMQWFGVEGIAMATSLMYVVATAATLAAIRQKLAIRGTNSLTD